MKESHYLIDAICLMLADHIPVEEWGSLTLRDQVRAVIQMHVLLLGEELRCTAPKVREIA